MLTIKCLNRVNYISLLYFELLRHTKLVSISRVWTVKIEDIQDKQPCSSSLSSAIKILICKFLYCMMDFCFCLALKCCLEKWWKFCFRISIPSLEKQSLWDSDHVQIYKWNDCYLRYAERMLNIWINLITTNASVNRIGFYKRGVI